MLLREYAVLDTPPEQAFDDVVRLATQICHVPIALVSLVDETRQWFKARVGLAVSSTPRESAFCAHAILNEAPLIVTVSEDTARRAALEAAGAEVVTVAAVGGKTDLVAVARMLAERGFNEVTVETGAKLNASLLQAGVVDEIVLYLAPLLLGNAAQGLFALPSLERLADGIRLRITDVRAVGADRRVTARLGT